MRAYHLYFLSLILILVEYVISRKRHPQGLHSWSEDYVTASTWILNYLTVVTALYFPYSHTEFFIFAQKHLSVADLRSFALPGPGWLRFLILFLFVDFTYYVSHRLSHSVNLFWTNHFTHHTITRLNIVAGHRDPLRLWRFNLLVLWLPVHVQFSPEIRMYANEIFMYIAIQSTWMHCPYIPKIKFLEYVFNTPSAHRVHHCIANQNRTMGVNFGGVLIIWDHLFGTYLEETTAHHQYGVPGFKASDRFFHVLFYQWWQFLKQLVACNSLRDVFETIFWKLEKRRPSPSYFSSSALATTQFARIERQCLPQRTLDIEHWAIKLANGTTETPSSTQIGTDT